MSPPSTIMTPPSISSLLLCNQHRINNNNNERMLSTMKTSSSLLLRPMKHRIHNNSNERMLSSMKTSSSKLLRTMTKSDENIIAATTTSYVQEYDQYIQKEIQIPLPSSSGVTMQVLLCYPKKMMSYSVDNVLLFIHGSFHAGWCWMEHYGPYFVNSCANTIVIAPSLRGTGGTSAGDNIKKVQIEQHISDIRDLLQSIPQIIQNHIIIDDKSPSKSSSINVSSWKPIIITHSFGGIVMMKYLEYMMYEKKNLLTSVHDIFRGMITICSVPPSGNGKMTLRYIRRSLRDSYKITVGFAMKKCINNIPLCRDLFFDDKISDHDIQRYQTYFDRDSKATIDLLDLGKQLPSYRTAIHPETGHHTASFLIDETDVYINNNIIVMGATKDFIVDQLGLIETAHYFGLQEQDIIYIESPHDIMLGTNWIDGAKKIKQIIHKW